MHAIWIYTRNGAVSARGFQTEMVKAVGALDSTWSDVTRLVLEVVAPMSIIRSSRNSRLPQLQPLSARYKTHPPKKRRVAE